MGLLGSTSEGIIYISVVAGMIAVPIAFLVICIAGWLRMSGRCVLLKVVWPLASLVLAAVAGGVVFMAVNLVLWTINYIHYLPYIILLIFLIPVMFIFFARRR